ncbi:MAG TPA: adenylate/guanylate cyclase domain-containing protein [Gaiellaceae bacterium]|jgi:class 3 adenylate cyclase
MVEVPSGTVTLLFTDVEGSTRLLKQLRQEYGQLLADHHRLMRAALEHHAGREMDTQGEAFFAVFPRAKDAVTAAISAQRAHADHDWPGRVDVRVRMGLHTAEPEVAGDRYYGLGVHRAARLCAVGHGGQVLLSRSTAGLVDEDEVPGVALRDLGEHLLKDLERPERIYQVLAEGLAEDFPPLKTVTEAARQSDIPTGTVTFLATDMVGFSDLVRKGNEFSGAVLDEHDRLLRKEFSKLGHVVDVVGDSFLVAFRRPQDAVRAAVDAQQALGSGDWPEDGQPAVRIGVHTGEVLRTESRYVGVALLRALQVCDAAAGGQVLLSQAAQSLLDPNDLGELNVRDLGERDLPDFERPVRVYEVIAAAAYAAND